MSTVTNLNKFRKSKARAAKRAQADENALRHGMTKAQRQAEQRDRTRAQTHLDGHKRSPDQDTP